MINTWKNDFDATHSNEVALIKELISAINFDNQAVAIRVLTSLLNHFAININLPIPTENSYVPLRTVLTAVAQSYRAYSKKEIFNFLINSPALDFNADKQSSTALNFLLGSGDDDACMTLLKAIYARHPIHNVASALGWDGNIPLVLLIMQQKNSWCASSEAAMDCAQKKFDLMLCNSGTDINVADKKGITPLMAASRVGWIYAVDALLARPEIELDAKDEKGNTALMFACQSPQYANGKSYQTIIQVIKKLFVAGVNYNLTNNEGNTAATLAMSEEMRQIILEANETVEGTFALYVRQRQQLAKRMLVQSQCNTPHHQARMDHLINIAFQSLGQDAEFIRDYLRADSDIAELGVALFKLSLLFFTFDEPEFQDIAKRMQKIAADFGYEPAIDLRRKFGRGISIDRCTTDNTKNPILADDERRRIREARLKIFSTRYVHATDSTDSAIKASPK